MAGIFASSSVTLKDLFNGNNINTPRNLFSSSYFLRRRLLEMVAYNPRGGLFPNGGFVVQPDPGTLTALTSQAPMFQIMHGTSSVTIQMMPSSGAKDGKYNTKTDYIAPGTVTSAMRDSGAIDDLSKGHYRANCQYPGFGNAKAEDFITDTNTQFPGFNAIRWFITSASRDLTRVVLTGTFAQPQPEGEDFETTFLYQNPKFAFMNCTLAWDECQQQYVGTTCWGQYDVAYGAQRQLNAYYDDPTKSFYSDDCPGSKEEADAFTNQFSSDNLVMYGTTRLGFGPCGPLGPVSWFFTAAGNNNARSYADWFQDYDEGRSEGCWLGGHVTNQTQAWFMIPYQPTNPAIYEQGKKETRP